jgi:hypothetical protein
MYRNILFSGIQLLAAEADKKTKFSNRSKLRERDKKIPNLHYRGIE